MRTGETSKETVFRDWEMEELDPVALKEPFLGVAVS